jgi:hypothetical protein
MYTIHILYSIYGHGFFEEYRTRLYIVFIYIYTRALTAYYKLTLIAQLGDLVGYYVIVTSYIIIQYKLYSSFPLNAHFCRFFSRKNAQ